jgi:hypothetical protein
MVTVARPVTLVDVDVGVGDPRQLSLAVGDAPNADFWRHGQPAAPVSIYAAKEEP